MKRDRLKITAGLFVLFSVFLTAHAADGSFVGSQGTVLTKAQAEVIVNRFDERVFQFIRQLGLGLDRSDLDKSSRDVIKKRSKDLDKAAVEHRTQFDARDNWIDNKEEIRRCMVAASEIDRAMQGHTLGTSTDSNWSRLRYELNSLAAAYALPPVGSNDYN